MPRSVVGRRRRHESEPVEADGMFSRRDGSARPPRRWRRVTRKQHSPQWPPRHRRSRSSSYPCQPHSSRPFHYIYTFREKHYSETYIRSDRALFGNPRRAGIRHDRLPRPRLRIGETRAALSCRPFRPRSAVRRRARRLPRPSVGRSRYGFRIDRACACSSGRPRPAR